MSKSIISIIKNVFTDKTLQKQNSIIDNFTNIDSIQNQEYIKNIIDKINLIKSDISVGSDVYNDVEFFDNFNQGLKSKTIFDVINCFHTSGAKSLAKQILSHPIYDIDILNKRKTILENFSSKMNEGDININEQAEEHIKKPALSNDIELFETLHTYEPNVMWLFENREKHIEDLLNIVYFRMVILRKLNCSASTLTGWNIYRILLSPLIGILSPIIYFLIPFLVITWKFKIPISFISYLKLNWEMISKGTQFMFPVSNTQRYITIISYTFSFIFYFQGLFNSVEVSKSLHKLCIHIIEKFNGVVKYLKASQLLIEKYWDDNLYNTFITKSDTLKNFSEESEYINNLKDMKFSLFSNFGKQLHGYKFVNRDIINSVMIKTYLIDCIRNILVTKNKYNFTFTKFIENNIPKIEGIGFRHPCLNKDNVVKNNININNNIIITGPNAGGKSTFIKTLLINVLLSQTICISTSDSCSLTPFKKINSQINVPDTKGHESLFEAEMHRCLYNLKELEKTNKNEFTFIIMDEIFNSTNPVEGIAAAYAIVKKISEYKNCILIFTTHYIYLTKLAKTTNRFINYKMNVVIDGENISFPYKLIKGLSKQYIALELLKQNGFDEQIINEAINIKNKLTTK
jgi:DNA mismatch repair ATPase MutS